MAKAESIGDILSKLRDTASEEDRLSIDDVLSAFGRKAYGPLIVLIGLISLSPIGSIPGASIGIAVLLILLMVQFIFVDKAPWIPDWIRDRSVESDRAQSSIEKVEPYAEWLEKFLKPRLEKFVESPWNIIAGIMVLVLALTLLPLALIPWGVAPPSLVIAIIGLALVTHDGQAMLIAFFGGLASLALTGWLLL